MAGGEKGLFRAYGLVGPVARLLRHGAVGHTKVAHLAQAIEEADFYNTGDQLQLAQQVVGVTHHRLGEHGVDAQVAVVSDDGPGLGDAHTDVGIRATELADACERLLRGKWRDFDRHTLRPAIAQDLGHLAVVRHDDHFLAALGNDLLLQMACTTSLDQVQREVDTGISCATYSSAPSITMSSSGHVSTSARWSPAVSAAHVPPSMISVLACRLVGTNRRDLFNSEPCATMRSTAYTTVEPDPMPMWRMFGFTCVSTAAKAAARFAESRGEGLPQAIAYKNRENKVPRTMMEACEAGRRAGHRLIQHRPLFSLATKRTDMDGAWHPTAEEAQEPADLRIVADDVDADVTEGGVETPMDDDEPEDEDVFEDNSLAAFYSHRQSVFCVQLHPQFPNPPLAVSGGEDDAAWIWNTIDGSEVAHLTGHTDSVVAVAFSHDGDMVATGGLDGRVRLWRRQDDAYTTWTFLTNLEGPSEIVWLEWHPRGPVLVAGASDTTVWMWKLPSGAEMNVFNGHTGSVTCGRFTPDGRRLVTGSDDGSLIVWDPASGAPLAKLKDTNTRFALDGGITSLAVSPDNKLVAVGGAAGGVRVVSIANIEQGAAAQVVGTLDAHDAGESVESVEFIDLLPSEAAGVLGSRTARTSTHLVSAATDGRVIVWDLALGKMRGEARHEAAVTKLVVHPYTPLFSTSSMDHRLRTWDARTMQLVGTQYGFTDGVLDVAVGVDDGLTQGADTGGIGAFVDPARSKGYKLVGAGDEGVALVFRLT